MHSPIVGGEKSKIRDPSRGIRIILVGVVAVVLVVGILWPVLESNYGIGSLGGGSQSKPIFTLTANLENPHPYLNFTNGYLNPNLWGLQKGNGNVTMSVFKNGSVHTMANLSDVYPQLIIGYPSEHFVHGLPMSLQDVYNNNLSSLVRFAVTNTSSTNFFDVSYDLFLGQQSLLQSEVQIMLIYKGATPSRIVSSINIPTMVNGQRENVTWIMYEGVSASGGFADWTFYPNISTKATMTYVVSLSSFLHFLQLHSYINSSEYVVREGIGSEFGSQFEYGSFFTTYSFWMYSYFILNGTKYQVVQPSEVITNE